MKEQIKSWKAERIVRKMARQENVRKKWAQIDRQYHNERKQSIAQIVKDLLDYDKKH